jgi:hypothetical protein
MSGKWPISVFLFALLLISAARTLIAAADETPNLKQNNLAVCAGKSPVPADDDPATVAQFANWIAGTWLLRTRTIQGVQVNTDSKYYIALDEITDKMATGWGLMIDKGNLHSMDYLRICPACLADASVGALWKVTITPDSGAHSIHLKMDGDYLGSYGDFRKGVQAVEQTHFHRYGDVFVAGQLKSPAGGQGLEDNTWDRVTLAGDAFTYMSCKNGFIDQFVKLSNGKPTVGGVRLQDAWPAIKASGVLLNPSPLSGGK